MKLDLSENNIRREILAALVQLRDQPDTRTEEMGICDNVHIMVRASMMPPSVQRTLSLKSRERMDETVDGARTMWQNPRRLELLNWLIGHAEELLNVA